MRTLITFPVAATLWPRSYDQAPPDSAQDKDLAATPAEKIAWTATPEISTGSASALEYGNPQTGLNVGRSRLPAGVIRAPHIHSSDECVTVISGKVLIGQGREIDEKKGVPIGVGGFWVTPAKTPHWLIIKENADLIATVNGPRDIAYCHPSDDPKNKK